MADLNWAPTNSNSASLARCAVVCQTSAIAASPTPITTTRNSTARYVNRLPALQLLREWIRPRARASPLGQSIPVDRQRCSRNGCYRPLPPAVVDRARQVEVDALRDRLRAVLHIELAQDLLHVV